MASNLVLLPYSYWADPTIGRPLSGGKIYVGEVDKDPESFPIDVFYIEENGTEIPADQPLTIGAGGIIIYNGKAVQIGVNSNYSMRVIDKNLAQVYNVPNNYNTGGATVFYVNQNANIHDTLAGAKSRTDLVINASNPMRLWIKERQAFFSPTEGLIANELDIIQSANTLIQLQLDYGKTLDALAFGFVFDGNLLTGAGTNNQSAYQRMLDVAVPGSTIKIGNHAVGPQTFLIDGDLDVQLKDNLTIEPYGRVEMLHVNGRFRPYRCNRFTFGPKFVMRGLAKDVYDLRQGSNRNTYSQSLYSSGGSGGGLELVLCVQSTVNDNDWSYFQKAITSDGSYISWFNNNRFNHNRVSIHPIIKTPFPDMSLVNDHQTIGGNVFGNHYEGNCISSRYLTNVNPGDTPGFISENASNTIATNLNKFETLSGSGLATDDHPYDIYLENTESTKIQSDVMVRSGGIFIKGSRYDVSDVKQYDIGTKELITARGDGTVKGCESYFSVNSGGDDFESAAGKTGIVASAGTAIITTNVVNAGNGVRTFNAGNSVIKLNEIYSSDVYCVRNADATVDVKLNKLRKFDTAEYFDISDNTGLMKVYENGYNSRDVATSVIPAFNPNRISFSEAIMNPVETTVPGNNELRPSSRIVTLSASANIIINVFSPTNPEDTLFDEFSAYFINAGQVSNAGNIQTKTGATVNITAKSTARFIRIGDVEWSLVY